MPDQRAIFSSTVSLGILYLSLSIRIIFSRLLTFLSIIIGGRVAAEKGREVIPSIINFK